MVPVGNWLARPANGVPEAAPCIVAADAKCRLHNLTFDEKLHHAAACAREMAPPTGT
jgi:hypothetical protein